MGNFAVFLVLLAATLWGGSGIFVRALTAAGLSSPQMTAMRLVVVLVVAPILLLLGGKKRFKINPKDLGWFFLNGLFGVLAFDLCYTYAIQLTSMATAAVLIYLMPSIVMLFSVFFLRERFTVRRALCLVLSFAGCALVSGVAGGLRVSPAGLAMGVAAAVCYSAYNLITPIKLSKYDSLTTIFYTFVFAAPLSVVYVALFDDLPGAIAIYTGNPGALAVNILLGLLCTIFTYWLYNTAVKHISASKAAIVATFEPVAAAVLGLLVLHETLSGFSLLGIGCELLALILLQLPAKKQNAQT